MSKNRISINFIRVTAAILISKLLGFVRDVLIASRFGTRHLSDVYLQVYGIPSLLFASIGMALSTINIPRLTYYINNRDKEDTRRYVSVLFAQISTVACIISAAGIIAAPWITRLILPGLGDEMTEISVKLTRIMFPTLLFIMLAYTTAGILQVHNHFLISTVISIPFNLLIITSLILTSNNLIILGYVTTIGWLLQFLIQVPVLKMEGYRLVPRNGENKKESEGFYKNLIPILMGNAVFQLCLVSDRAFASHQEGAASALAYGSNLFITITSIFIVAMSTVAFPDLSKFCLDRDFEKVRLTLNYIFKVLTFILIPFLIIVSIYNKDIITLIYMRGDFSSQSVKITSTAFLLYSFCIAGYVSQEIFNRVYYALKKYKTPMMLSFICVMLNLVLDFISYRYLGVMGIAASTALAFSAYSVLMFWRVRKEIGSFLGKGFAKYLLKLAICAAGMVLIFLIFRLLHPEGVMLSLLLPIIAGGVFYLVIAYFYGVLQETILRRT